MKGEGLEPHILNGDLRSRLSNKLLAKQNKVVQDVENEKVKVYIIYLLITMIDIINNSSLSFKIYFASYFNCYSLIFFLNI